jgi:hypothetical protein
MRRPGTDTPRLSEAANAANGREGFRPNDCATAAEVPSRRDRRGSRSRPRPTLRGRIAASTEAMPHPRLVRLPASPSRRSTRFGLRLPACGLRGRRDFGLGYAGVGGCAVFGGRTPFDAVDRTALFVRPIDCRHEAAFAQPSQSCACRVRKPARHKDQLGDARAAILLKQFDDPRQLRPASWRG